jgi:hypothetical protein
MALDRTKLQRIGGALPQLHIYNSAADNIATVTGSGYFNAVTDQLRQYDVIIVISTAGSVIDMIFVNSATGAAVVTTIGAEGITATVLAANEREAEKARKEAEKAEKEAAKV